MTRKMNLEESSEESDHGLELVTTSLEKKVAYSEELEMPEIHYLEQCEWFVCDDSHTYTRCVVIRGSGLQASWEANLLFKTTTFEGTDELVHEGIYKAAKGIYHKLIPLIHQHFSKYGDRSKLRFTGHSIGGSISLLVNLMLLARREVEQSALLPVVIFGSPYIFCNGQKILDQLNLNENHVQCVIMHRDIVPRAFIYKYPDYVPQILNCLNNAFQYHSYVWVLAFFFLAVFVRITNNSRVNKNEHTYNPIGKIFILQPNERSSAPHPLLPLGLGFYTLCVMDDSLKKRAICAFLNCPNLIETLTDATAYGSDGKIEKDHDASNYLKALNEILRRYPSRLVRKARKQSNQMWPLLSSRHLVEP